MTHPQQTTREVIEQLVGALDHCMDAITERGLNGSPDQAEKWGLQLPLARAESAITAAQSMLANPTPSTTWEAPKRIWSASNRTATLLFWTEADARQAAAYSVAAGLEVGSIPVFGNPPKVEPAPGPEQALQRLSDLGRELQPEDFVAARTFNSGDFEGTETAPSTAGERDNKTEMLAKLTAWLDGLGGSIHTYSLRGIALDGFEKGWSAALMQSTALPEPYDFPSKIMRQLTIMADRVGDEFHGPWEDGDGEPLQDDADAAIAWINSRAATMPVGELTLEQITRIYDRYGGDMVNCTRAIERELAAASSQPVREPLTPDTHYQEWKHGCDSMCTNITLWIDRCPHCGKPRPVVEAAHGITKKGAVIARAPSTIF